MADYEINDSGGREMLLQICAAADRVAECAEEIARDGPVIRTKAGLKDHLLLRHELSARSLSCGRCTGLDIEPTRNSVGRPSGTFSRVR